MIMNINGRIRSTPTINVVLNISHKQQKHECNNQTFRMGPNNMPLTEKDTNIGTIESSSQGQFSSKYRRKH